MGACFLCSIYPAERTTLIAKINPESWMLKGSFHVRLPFSSFIDCFMLIQATGLLSGLVILGRAPGFRKSDVRRALQASIKTVGCM
jgi:hypothetical protein